MFCSLGGGRSDAGPAKLLFLSSVSRAVLVQYISSHGSVCPIFWLFIFSAVVLLHSFHLLNGLFITTPGITVCVTDNVPGQTRVLFTTQVNPIAAARTPDGLNGRLCNSK